MSASQKEIIYGVDIPEVTVTAQNLSKPKSTKYALETDWAPQEVR